MSENIRKRGDSWCVEIMVKGIRHIKSFQSLASATRWRNKKISERGLTLGEVLQEAETYYIEHKGERDKSVLRIRSFLRDFLYIAEMRVIDIKSEDLRGWQIQRLQTVKPSTVNREQSILSAAWRKMIKGKRYRIQNPFSDIEYLVPPPPRNKRIPPALEEQILTNLQYQPGNVPKMKKQLLGVFFRLALETGMRLGEICNIDFNNINAKDCCLLLPKTKNGDERQVPLTQKSLSLLQTYQDSNLRMTMEKASALFRKYLRQINIQDLHFHDTRHEAITRMSRKVNVLELARIVGHRDVKSLMIYYNPTTSELAARLEGRE